MNPLPIIALHLVMGSSTAAVPSRLPQLRAAGVPIAHSAPDAADAWYPAAGPQIRDPGLARWAQASARAPGNWLLAANDHAVYGASASAATVPEETAVRTGAVTEIRPSAVDPRRTAMLRAYRVLEIATGASLVTTGTLGVIIGINQATAFGPGRCATNDAIGGSYGCTSMSIVHGISAVSSLTLYTATEVLNLATPNPPWASMTGGRRAVYRTFTAIHLIGMILQPLMGIFSAYPEVIGIHDANTRYDFQRTMRTIHMGLGIVIAGSYVTTTALDF